MSSSITTVCWVVLGVAVVVLGVAVVTALAVVVLGRTPLEEMG